MIVPDNVTLIIEKMSVMMQFEATDLSADPVEIKDVVVTFRDHDVTAVRQYGAIPTTSRTSPPDPTSGRTALTTSEGTTSEKIVLDPGSLIALRYKVVGATDSVGEAHLTLLGHVVLVGKEPSDGDAVVPSRHSLAVTNTAGEPVRLESAVPMAPLKIVHQSSRLRNKSGRAGTNIDILTVPQGVSLVIETMSVLIRFEPTSTSAGPVRIEDVVLRFPNRKLVGPGESRAIPVTSSTRPPDSYRDIRTSTLVEGITSERIVLDRGGAPISLQYAVVGASDSVGEATLTLLGHVAPPDDQSSDK